MKPDLKGLTKLAQRLRRVPKKQFDMDTWLKDAPCGTVGCIAGWAATMFPSRFRKEKWESSYDNLTHYDIIHRRSNTSGEEAFAHGFRIPYNLAEELTVANMEQKKTPEKAAKAVMALVGKLRKELKG